MTSSDTSPAATATRTMAGEDAWMTNFSAHPITHGGRTWPTAEHAF